MGAGGGGAWTDCAASTFRTCARFALGTAAASSQLSNDSSSQYFCVASSLACLLSRPSLSSPKTDLAAISGGTLTTTPSILLPLGLIRHMRSKNSAPTLLGAIATNPLGSAAVTTVSTVLPSARMSRTCSVFMRRPAQSNVSSATLPIKPSASAAGGYAALRNICCCPSRRKVPASTITTTSSLAITMRQSAAVTAQDVDAIRTAAANWTCLCQRLLSAMRFAMRRPCCVAFGTAAMMISAFFWVSTRLVVLMCGTGPCA